MAGTSAGTVAVGTVPGAGGARAVAAGCNMAAGLAGSNHSHLAVHTAVASAAVGTASLPGPLEPGPACQGDTAVRLGGRRHLLGMGCSAAAANGGECPSHTTEVSSSPLGPSDCPVKK